MKGISHDSDCFVIGDLDDASEGVIYQCKLFSLRSDLFFKHHLRVKLDVIEKLRQHNIQ